MRIKVLAVTLAAALMAVIPPAGAEPSGLKEMTKSGTYAEVRDDLKNAIVNRGFVVDYVGQFNGMLERTSEAVGAAKTPYTNAEFMQFCAAKLTHDRARDHFIGIGFKKRTGRLKIIRVAHGFRLVFQQSIEPQRYRCLPDGAGGGDGFLGMGYKKGELGHKKGTSFNWFDSLNWLTKKGTDIFDAFKISSDK